MTTDEKYRKWVTWIDAYEKMDLLATQLHSWAIPITTTSKNGRMHGQGATNEEASRYALAIAESWEELKLAWRMYLDTLPSSAGRIRNEAPRCPLNPLPKMS